MPGGITDYIVLTAAVIGGLSVIATAIVRVYRAVKHAWVHAVAEQVDPKIAAVRDEVAALRADGEARFDELDSRIGKPNGKGDLVTMLEKLLHRVEQEDEVARLAREGRIDRRTDDA